MIKKLTLLSAVIFFSVSLFAQDELCPAVGLTVFGGNQENIIAWAEPVGNIGCGDFPVDELPFSHVSTNVGMGNDWPVSPSEGDDVAYTLNVSQATTYDITLCSENTDYDTKLEIYLQIIRTVLLPHQQVTITMTQHVSLVLCNHLY